MRSEPQQVQLVGASTTTRSRVPLSSLQAATAGQWMIWKGFTHWLAPREGPHGAGFICSSVFRRQRILRGGGFQSLKLQFQLIDQSCATLRGDPVFVAPQLGDLQLQFLDHCFHAGGKGAGLRQFGLCRLGAGLCGLSRGGLRSKCSASFGDFQGGI
tara:strand:- start:1498 stop:1968 length:471 start_codon:yes stop_codon:yes gene_type:complete